MDYLRCLHIPLVFQIATTVQAVAMLICTIDIYSLHVSCSEAEDVSCVASTKVSREEKSSVCPLLHSAETRMHYRCGD